MLSVNAKIGGVDIYLDGKYVGKTDNNGTITITDVPEGKHTIKAEKEGYYDAVATIDVPNQLSVTLKLKRKTYTVEVVVK